MIFDNTPTLLPFQKEIICQMWNSEFPSKLAITMESFNAFLDSTKHHDHYLMSDKQANIMSWAFTFDRDDDRWFSMIIAASFQHQGLGSLMINRLEEKESRLNGWVIDHPGDVKQNGDAYISPLTFYIKNGFTIVPEVRFEDPKLSAVKIEWRR